MNALTRPYGRPQHVTVPAQPDVDLYTAELGEVTKASPSGHCHHSSACLSPLRVGELVVPVGPFFALLDHLEVDERSVHVIALNTGGVPKRL